ncbi:MAG: class I SAM-dependent RNA methyltransferase, partial [Chitinophagaceae bacterium]|nr:class I SAM-dependent RNA methyltransferase [Chitinophagaceae bacterium]
MSLYDTKGAITITCNKRLAPYVEQEVRELGFTIEETFITGVRTTGTLNDCIRLNLNLRCASQVLYSLKQFRAYDADMVYKNIHSYAWEKLLP